MHAWYGMAYKCPYGDLRGDLRQGVDYAMQAKALAVARSSHSKKTNRLVVAMAATHHVHGPVLP